MEKKDFLLYQIKMVNFISLLLALSLVLFAAACGGGSAAGPKPLTPQEKMAQLPKTANYVLIKQLYERDPNTRLNAVKSLIKLGPNAKDAIPVLFEVAAGDRHPNVKRYATIALVKIDPDNQRVVRLAIAKISDPNANNRKRAIGDFFKAQYMNDEFLEALRNSALMDPHKRVKQYAATVYNKLKTRQALKGKIPEKRLTPPTQVAQGTPAQTTETITPGITFQFPKAKEVNKEAVAVIIGNKNYEIQKKNVPDVKYAHNDADAVYKYVTETLGFRAGNVMHIKDATQADLVAAFGTKGNHYGKLSDWVRPGKSDVFVFYSGHGAPSLKDGSSYLLPVDADPMKVELNGYALETLYTNLSKIESRNMTVVIDACFSGSSSGGTVVTNASSISLKVVKPKVSNNKATVLTAADVSEVASWDEEGKYGLFTRYFIEGVIGKADSAETGNKDGKVDLSELKTYLSDEVSYRARRLFGREQHPQISGESSHILSEIY